MTQSNPNLSDRRGWGQAQGTPLSNLPRAQYSCLAAQPTSKVLWPLADNLGTIRDIAVSDGTTTTIVNHITYDAFGHITDEQNLANPTAEPADHIFGFTGRERDDESGLNYYRARYYDPTVGRFISQDPIGFDAGDANLYRYVGNGPTNAIDPSGLEEGSAYSTSTGAFVGEFFSFWGNNYTIAAPVRKVFEHPTGIVSNGLPGMVYDAVTEAREVSNREGTSFIRELYVSSNFLVVRPAEEMLKGRERRSGRSLDGLDYGSRSAQIVSSLAFAGAARAQSMQAASATTKPIATGAVMESGSSGSFVVTVDLSHAGSTSAMGLRTYAGPGVSSSGQLTLSGLSPASVGASQSLLQAPRSNLTQLPTTNAPNPGARQIDGFAHVDDVTVLGQGQLQHLSNKIRVAGNHPAAVNQRTIAVGRDSQGKLFAGSSNGFDAGQRAAADAMGIPRVPSRTIPNPQGGRIRLHAEENLLDAVQDLRSVGTSKRFPCGPGERGCGAQLQSRGVRVDNR